MKQAQKGNDKAFLKLFQKFEQDIYRMAYVYVKNQEDALDVVQEVAYRSFKKVETLKQPEYFKTWLMKITISCAVDCLRKHQKVVPLKPEYEEIMGSEGEDIPLSLSLQGMIDTLQEEEKSVVLLRFYHNCTFKEISEMIDIPLGTTKTILYRALGKLRKEMKEADICE